MPMLVAASQAQPANKGRFANETEALDWLVGRLVETLDPAAVWLFGSRARGGARPDSDFDLLVVAKPGGAFGSEDYDLVYQPTCGSGIGCDVVPCSMEDFIEASNVKTSFVRAVLNEGRCLYETPGAH